MKEAPELWLAIVEPDDVRERDPKKRQRVTDEQWHDILSMPGLTGVSIRVPSRNSVQLAREVKEHDLALDLEMWCGEAGPADVTLADAADGALVGAQAAYQVRIHPGAAGFRANMESATYRGDTSGPKPLANPTADEYGLALQREYRRHDVGKLHSLGYYWLAKYYAEADLDHDGHLDNTIHDEVKDGFDRVWIMSYGGNERAVRERIERARKEWPGHWLGVYITPPRLNKNGTLLSKLDLYYRLAAEGLVQGITIYIGFDQSKRWNSPQNPWTTLTMGNRKAGPVTDWMASVYDLGVDGTGRRYS